MKINDALLQSAAVWAPDKVSEQLSVGSNQRGAAQESETPTSFEEWKQMTGIKA